MDNRAYDRIRAEVTARLSAAKDSTTKTEVIDELSANLYEEYLDLANAGQINPLHQVLSGIGDVSELIDYVNQTQDCGLTGWQPGGDHWGGSHRQDGQYRYRGSGQDQYRYEYRSGRQEQNAGQQGDWQAPWSTGSSYSFLDDLSGMVTDVIGTVKGFAKPIIDAARDSAQAYYTHADPFGGSRKETASEFCHSWAADRVNTILLSSINGNIRVFFTDNENIVLREKADRLMDAGRQASVHLGEDGVLRISQGRTAAGGIFFSRGFFASDFTLELPRRQWKLLSLSAVSGSIDVQAGLQADELRLKTTSGDIDCPAESLGRLTADTVSGAIRVSGPDGEATLNTTSGSITLTGSPRILSCKSSSGELAVHLNDMPSELNLSNTSGSIGLWLPENNGFSVSCRWSTGTVRCEFDAAGPGHGPGDLNYKGGGNRPPYRLSSTSGNISIRRRTAS